MEIKRRLEGAASECDSQNCCVQKLECRKYREQLAWIIVGSSKALELLKWSLMENLYYSQRYFFFFLILFESLEILLARNIPFCISNEISHDATPWTGYPARLFIIRTWDISRFEEDGKLSGNGKRLSMLNRTIHIGQILLSLFLRVKLQSTCK